MPQLAKPHETGPSWSVVYTTYNLSEAHIVAGRLENEGIHAWVHQEPMGSAMGITVGRLGEVRVLVAEPDYEAALAILEQPPGGLLPEDIDQIIYDPEETDDDE